MKYDSVSVSYLNDSTRISALHTGTGRRHKTFQSGQKKIASKKRSWKLQRLLRMNLKPLRAEGGIDMMLRDQKQYGGTCHFHPAWNALPGLDIFIEPGYIRL